MKLLDTLKSYYESNPTMTAGIAALGLYLVMQNWEKIRPLLGKVVPYFADKQPTNVQVAFPDNLPITESTVAGDDRLLAFYYIDQLRHYSVTTGNVKAVETCNKLLTDLMTFSPEGK